MRKFYPGQEFLAYFKRKTEGMSEEWDQTYEYFYDFCKSRCSFYNVDLEKCLRFEGYLLDQNLHALEQYEIYKQCFRSIIKQAYEEEELSINLYEELEDTDKNYKGI